MRREKPLKNQVVFVVDDDQAVCQSIALLVEAMRVKVEIYNSAEEFLKAVQTERHGCLVTDIRMLGMSGVELLHEISNRGWKLPTIVVTGYADVQLTLDVIQAGAMTLLQKPYREHDLWASIASALKKSKNQAELIELQQSVRDRLSQLTPQEYSVLREMLLGSPNKIIATKLEIPARTVDLRRQCVLAKMEAECAIHIFRILSEAEVPLAEVMSPPVVTKKK